MLHGTAGRRPHWDCGPWGGAAQKLPGTTLLGTAGCGSNETVGQLATAALLGATPLGTTDSGPTADLSKDADHGLILLTVPTVTVAKQRLMGHRSNKLR